MLILDLSEDPVVAYSKTPVARSVSGKTSPAQSRVIEFEKRLEIPDDPASNLPVKLADRPIELA